jgi:hypothetical protein
MHDSVFGMCRGINRKHLHQIWKKAQKGELQGLNEQGKRLSGKAANRQSGNRFKVFQREAARYLW